MDFHELAAQQFKRAAEKLGGDPDQDLLLDEVTGLSEEDRNGLIAFVQQHIYVNFVGNTVSGAFTGGVDPQQLIDLCAQVTPPVIIAICRSLYEEREQAVKSSDKHLAALEAEISLTSMISENSDLSAIWPTEIAQDVVKVFDDPVKAFYAGVICGRRDG